MSVYFISDHHFGQAAARSFYRRPFASVAEMDQEMIDRWNFVVSPGDEDEVWHLGDFAVRQSAERVAYLLATLYGRKHLIVGTTTTPWSPTARPLAGHPAICGNDR
jgi:calcineurin-like phosphoesterase family protein